MKKSKLALLGIVFDLFGLIVSLAYFGGAGSGFFLLFIVLLVIGYLYNIAKENAQIRPTEAIKNQLMEISKEIDAWMQQK